MQQIINQRTRMDDNQVAQDVTVANLVRATPYVRAYENDVDAFIPELWSAEGLLTLQANMVAGGLVYRDFENELKNYGDTVNVRIPGGFTAKRKTNSDNVVVQDVSATSIQVKLDQHVHTSFLIRDGEESRSFEDLIATFLVPAVEAQAVFIDRMVLGQYPRFMDTAAGGINNLTNLTAKDALIYLNQVLNVAKVPAGDRHVVVNPISQGALLGTDIFTNASIAGADAEKALRDAQMGNKLGLNFWMSQNMPVIATGGSVGLDTVAGATAAGSTTITVTTGTAGNFVVGTWLTIAGDYTPRRISAFNSGTKVVTLTTPLRTAVANGAVVTTTLGGTVNNSGGYPIGYAKEITIAGFTVALQVGQMVTFAGDTTRYSVMEVNGLVGIVLDRPLVNALTNTQAVLPGPAGAFNLAFHRQAIALVVRPLAPPRTGLAKSAVMNENGLSMRTTITYDGNKQGHLVTVDMLCGIAVLNTALGAVFLG